MTDLTGLVDPSCFKQPDCFKSVFQALLPGRESRYQLLSLTK